MHEPMTLTLEQQELVEHYLSVIDWVILDHIHINPQICGLGYDDVYQEGCLHLCRAAATYTGDPANFGAYARVVVRNGLLSYCRRLCQQEAALPLSSEATEASVPREREDTALEQAVLQKLIREDLFRELHRAHTESSGVVRLGIEALELKAKGFSGQEIAAMYQVKPNHVGAWISRAASRLRRSPAFMKIHTAEKNR